MADNPIVIENQKPGNPQSEWDIVGGSSDTIVGFATRISVNKGQQVDFKINTPSANYRIDIYRLGYYGGMGARKVQTIQRNTASNQPAAGGDASIGLWDAGNWSVTASWAVPATAVSGVYNAQLTNYKIFVAWGHDEYWSGDQRAHVEAARDAGVNMCFFSGNEVYWKTRWEPDLNGTPNRTLVCYKESKAAGKIDPSPEWTGTWRDPGFTPPSDGGRPENS